MQEMAPGNEFHVGGKYSDRGGYSPALGRAKYSAVIEWRKARASPTLPNLDSDGCLSDESDGPGILAVDHHRLSAAHWRQSRRILPAGISTASAN